VSSRASALFAFAAALALGVGAGADPSAFQAHAAWPVSDDAGWATAPAIGVAALADERPEELRAGWRPGLAFRRLGFAREGTERTGDGDFPAPPSEAAREELVETLRRAGVFASVTPADFDPRDPAAWPEASPPALVLTGALESFGGSQWRSLTVSPLQVGFVRERWGPAQGRVTLRLELWSKAERVWEGHISARSDSPDGDARGAALEALALGAEKVALRLDARLRAPRAFATRMLSVRVLDACGLGDARVRRLLAETGAIFEREAGIAFTGAREPWTPSARRTTVDSLLDELRRVTPPAGGVVLGLAPAQRVRELGLGSVHTGLSDSLGTHSLALCAGEDEASVLTTAHELAHLFGAVHVLAQASIMHATADFDARFFDPLNRRVLRRMRERDFARPLTEPEHAALAELYRGAERDLVDPGDVETARRALDQAGGE
jgi:hypothetical protein